MAVGLTRTEQYALIGVIGLITVGMAIHGLQRARSEGVAVTPAPGNGQWEQIGVVNADGTATFNAMAVRATPAPDKRIDINQAGVVELDRLPGIGAAKAQAIIETRERLGGFRSIEQLDEVKGIGAATVEKLRPLIRVSETSAAREVAPVSADGPAGLQ